MLLLRWLAIALTTQWAWGSDLPQEERCVTAVYSAYNYITFAGGPPKGLWDTRCQNPLKVASIYAASDVYCRDRERAAGLSQLAAFCEEFGHLELLPRAAVAENLTDDVIRDMRKVDYLELDRSEPTDNPVLISSSYFNLMFNTITYVLWGILAFFVMIFLLVASLDRIRFATYETFLILHIVFSVITLVACFYHTVVFEGHEYWQYLWPSVAVWVLDRALRVLRLVYCNIHVGITGRNKIQSTQSRMSYDEDANVIRLEMTPGTKALQPKPGDYYFLYQPLRFVGWENHPFTVGAWSYDSISSTSPPRTSGDVSQLPLLSGASIVDESREAFEDTAEKFEESRLKLIFWVRPYDGWTQNLRRECLRSKGQPVKTTILLEGPYGHNVPLWSRELRPALGRDDFQASFYTTRPSVETPQNELVGLGFQISTGRPHIQSLIMSRACDASAAGSTLAVLVCGPAGMADEARSATHLAMRQGYRSIKYVEESFTW
ncbi:uncharacterized protein N7469_003223 [Penicillium citrinum]|uniref:FAD-binding FR-type domain-containing protein n=1 Tax=Penicillium citrinum TaxID=5077 RepID=A0A9W9PEX6_PENCI|nr:uncharacterized protein N7469_003223 [Penicillium citrinum]KAJ5241632.1 hypothetical protein N7469_003223 [Penicillium citrinum]